MNSRTKDQLFAVAVLFAVIFSVSAFAKGREGLERIRREYASALIARTTQAKSVVKRDNQSTSEDKKSAEQTEVKTQTQSD